MTDFRLAGIDVPRIGLGTNRLTTAPEHVTFVRDAVAAGRAPHRHRASLQRAARASARSARRSTARSEDVLVATKGGYGGAGEGRPEVLQRQIEQSLRSLRTEAIGLYYLHRVDPRDAARGEPGRDQGVCRPRRDPPRRGVGGERGADRAGPPGRADRRGAEPLQPGRPQATTTSIDYCEREGIAFVPYYPLRGDGGPGVAAAAEAPRRFGEHGQAGLAAATARPSSFPFPARSRSRTCARTSRHSSCGCDDSGDIAD